MFQLPADCIICRGREPIRGEIFSVFSRQPLQIFPPEYIAQIWTEQGRFLGKAHIEESAIYEDWYWYRATVIQVGEKEEIKVEPKIKKPKREPKRNKKMTMKEIMEIYHKMKVEKQNPPE